MEIERIKIQGIRISVIDYASLLSYINEAISTNSHRTIAYANVNLLNYNYHNEFSRENINSFDIVHPDGVGVYIASKILYGSRGLKARFTGSDFYPYLAKEAIKNKWRIYFFGHDVETLGRIKDNYPELNVAGTHDGYVFIDDDMINNINESEAQILILGLGHGRQEQWLMKNAGKLKVNVSIVVGDGISVFAGVKLRGPKFMRTIGLEWFVRFLSNPFKYWKRYIIGNPLFLYRIFRDKLAKL